MTAVELYELSFEIHPVPCYRYMQGDKIRIVEIKSGVMHEYDLTGLSSKSDAELDEMYFKKFGNKAWHMSRIGYILSLAKTTTQPNP